MEPHHVALAGGWSLWDCFVLRGAGFEASRMAQLASVEYAHDVDQWSQRSEAFEIELATTLSGSVGRVGRWGSRALEALRTSRLADAPPTDPSLEVIAVELAELVRERSALEQRHASELLQIGAQLRATVADRRFREAVIWQNRRVLHTAMDALARSPVGSANTHARQREQLVAAYLQRYCTKNDSIGFFGPWGFGALSRDVPAIEYRPGPELLAQRSVYFEQWCVARLAEVLLDDERLKPWLPPRMTPTIRIEGAIVHHPGGAAEIPAGFAGVLSACDGVRTAREIAERAIAGDAAEFSELDEVYDLLEQFEQQGLLSWRIAIPAPGLERCESWLHRTLERIDDPDVRATARGRVAELEAARTAVTNAAGDPDALDGAIAAFEQVFERLTGSDSTRNPGQSYGGRTLLYEDCRRDCELRIGATMLDRLGPPLALVLQSARWFTHVIAERYRVAFREVFDEVRGDATEIDYVAFAQRIEPLFGTLAAPHAFVADAVAELQKRWHEILALDERDRRSERRTGELAAAVMDRFAAPAPGWPGARFQSPDLAVAAADVDAIARGDYLFVLGELHAGANTFSGALAQHPDPVRIVEAFERDVPFARVDFVSRARAEARVDHASPSRLDVDIELGSAMSNRARDRVIAVGQLIVAETPDGLVVRTRDGGRELDIIAFHERQLATTTMSQFRITGANDHLPRVTIDSLVISRERWTVRPAELHFAHAATSFERFLGARRWAASLGLPRYVFYKIPEEPKPVFLDLASPTLVERFAKEVRRSTSIAISEMLPGLDELWLHDAERRAYTSELRIIAVDPVGWSRCQTPDHTSGLRARGF